jgi:type IX secretion system PorP/SprF family membrane protein
MMRAQLTLMILFVPAVLMSQERVVSFNQWVAATYQPSSSAWDNAMSFSSLSNRTYLGSDVGLQSNTFSGEYPLVRAISGRRLGGVAFHVIKKDAGVSDFLTSTHAGLSLAYNMPIAVGHFMHFGLQGVFNQMKTSLEQFTTGNQWLAHEFRFDPSASIGESILENRVRYSSINAGLSWLWEDHPSGIVKMIAGFTVFNLNSPNVSFFQTGNRLPRSLLLHVGSQLYHNQRFDFWSQIFYKHTLTDQSLYSQISTKIHFSNENPYDILQSGSIELTLQYDFQNSLMTGIALHQTGISVAFDYNFGLAVTSAELPFRNGAGIAVRLSKTIWKKKPSVILVKGTEIGARRAINFVPSPEEKAKGVITPQPSDVEVIQKNIHDVSKVNSVRFELDKDFKYAFGKSELSADARRYLDELGSLLQKNPDYRLEVIGHTDNVGKPSVNYRLSSARAQVVANYLIQNGLSQGRIKYAGRGDTEPLGSNANEEDRAKNRRVHFIIYVNR